MATSTPPPEDPYGVSQKIPNPKAYPVQKVDNLGVWKYLIRQEKGGTCLLACLCNALIVLDRIELKDEDVHDGIVSEVKLYYKLAAVGPIFKWSEQKKVEWVIKAFKESKPLDPTFYMVSSFKEPDLSQALANILQVPIFHGHVLNPVDVQSKLKIDERALSAMRKALSNKKGHLKRGKHKDIGDDWRKIDELINSHTPYSVTCLKQKIRTEVSFQKMKGPVCIFIWNDLLSTVKLHDDGDLYVLDAAQSCIVNKVLWQRLTVITDPKDVNTNVFFDSEFTQVVLHDKDDGEPSHTRTVDANADKTKFVQILDQYGLDFISKDLASAVINSIEKNTRLVAELDWTLVSPQMPKIISDHSLVYSMCVHSLMDTTEESLVTKAAAIRKVKDSILRLVIEFVQKAEVSEKLEEDCIVPFMNIVLRDYFGSAQNEISDIKSFSMNIVEKCEKIDQIFQVAFAPRHGQMEAAKHLYLFSLLAKISSCRFKLVTKLPFELVLKNFCEELKENNTLIAGNVDSIVELLGNFENSIKGETLLGSDLNGRMLIIFDTIVSLYRSVYARKEPSSPSEEKRSFEIAIYKLVEAFLEKAARLEDPDKEFIISLMKEVLNDYVKIGAEIPSEFLHLSKMFVKKCSGALIIIETLFNCSRERTIYEEQYGYILSFLEEACAHCSQFLNQLPLPQLRCVMEFISWAMMDTKYSIGKTGVNLLIKILKAFKAPDVPNTCFKEHILAIMDATMTILIRFPDSEMESLCFDLLKQVFNVIDKLSEPLWDDKKVPTHYNSMFAREHTANFLESKCQTLSYLQAAKFVDEVFEATNDSACFFERASNILLKLKTQQQICGLDFASNSDETRPSSSKSATYHLVDETCGKRCEEKLKDFLRTYTEKDCHSPYYEGVVVAMYWTGLNKLEINFQHIISYDPIFASDFLIIYSRFQRKINAVVTDFMSHVKNKLDKALRESKHLTLSGEISVFVKAMPASLEGFSEFIKIPGNEILRKRMIFDSVDVEEKTDIGILALCSYVQDMCEAHSRGESWDGNLTLADFMVLNKTEFRIFKKPCASSSQLTESNDFATFATELLPLYGNSAYVKVLINDMKLYIKECDYTPRTARHFRFRMITHLAGKSPVLISLIFLDLWRGYRLLCSHARVSVAQILCRELTSWKNKVKSNTILLSLYNYQKIGPKILDRLRLLEGGRLEQGDSDDEEETIDKQLDGLVAATDVVDQLKKLAKGESLDGLDAATDVVTNAIVEETVGANEVAGLKECLGGDDSQQGDVIYDDSLVSVVRYVRHGVIHLGDPNNVGKILIKKLIELQMLLSQFLEEEMSHVIEDLIQNSHLFTEDILEMLEDSWKIYARTESNRHYTEPLGLRDLKSF